MSDSSLPVLTPIPLHVRQLVYYIFSLQSKVEDKFIQPLFIPNSKQLADILTKPLGRIAHWFIISKLGLHNPCGPPICGESTREYGPKQTFDIQATVVVAQTQGNKQVADCNPSSTQEMKHQLQQCLAHVARGDIAAVLV